MIFGFAVLATAVFLSLVAAYYSVVGLTAIFAAATIPVIIMGGALELGKIMATVWLHNNWRRAGIWFKLYLIPAVVFLMMLTSMGIFGFLSKAHLDQAVMSGDATTKIAIYDEKIKAAKDNIETNRRALKQMDDAVEQLMNRTTDEQGATRAANLRRQQQGERTRLQNEIAREQTRIQQLSEERAPVAAEVRKVEAEVGPIKYVAALLYNDNPDQNVLEKAVRFVIIMIVIVFDPLALCLILAANKQFEWAMHGQGGWVHEEDNRRVESEKRDHWDRIKSIWPFGKRPDLKNTSHYVDNTSERSIAEESVLDVVQDRYRDLNDMPEPVPTGYKYGAWPFPHLAGEPMPEPKVDYKVLDDADEETPVKKPEEEIIAEVSNLVAEETLQATGPEPHRVPEAAPGPNRGRIYSRPIQADNAEVVARGSNNDFGNEFPTKPEKGDTYLRTDYLPNRLYKYNGKKWIEVDKNNNDLYVYDDLYIKHLIDEIEAGRYDPDALTDLERQQIRDYLEKNA